MLLDVQREKGTTTRMETIQPPKSWSLTKTEKIVLDYATEFVTNKAGYMVSLFICMIDKFPDGDQLGSCNYETQNGKVFALDVYIVAQKPQQRLMTILHELGHVMDYYTISEDEPELAKEFCDVDKFDIHKAVGIGFEAEKRAWYWAHRLMVDAGIATPKMTRALFKDKYDSLEVGIIDLYDTIKKERRTRKKEDTEDARKDRTSPTDSRPDGENGHPDPIKGVIKGVIDYSVLIED